MDKRDMIPGGIAEIDLKENSESVKTVRGFAKTAAEKICSKFGCPNGPNSVILTGASQQVVQGMLYKLKMKIVKEDCDIDSPECPTGDCEVSVWYRPWLQEPNHTIYRDLKCKQ